MNFTLNSYMTLDEVIFYSGEALSEQGMPIKVYLNSHYLHIRFGEIVFSNMFSIDRNTSRPKPLQRQYLVTDSKTGVQIQISTAFIYYTLLLNH